MQTVTVFFFKGEIFDNFKGLNLSKYENWVSQNSSKTECGQFLMFNFDQNSNF